MNRGLATGAGTRTIDRIRGVDIKADESAALQEFTRDISPVMLRARAGWPGVTASRGNGSV